MDGDVLVSDDSDEFSFSTDHRFSSTQTSKGTFSATTAASSNGIATPNQPLVEDIPFSSPTLSNNRRLQELANLLDDQQPQSSKSPQRSAARAMMSIMNGPFSRTFRRMLLTLPVDILDKKLHHRIFLLYRLVGVIDTCLVRPEYRFFINQFRHTGSVDNMILSARRLLGLMQLTSVVSRFEIRQISSAWFRIVQER
jgi:hypothetical protein